MGKSCVDLLMVDCRQELLQLVWKLKGPLGVVEQLTEGVFVDACGWLIFQSPELSTDHASTLLFIHFEGLHFKDALIKKDSIKTINEPVYTAKTTKLAYAGIQASKEINQVTHQHSNTDPSVKLRCGLQAERYTKDFKSGLWAASLRFLEQDNSF